MATKTNAPTKELVNRELLIIQKYLVNVKSIKCSLEWWKKMNRCSLMLDFQLKKYRGLLIPELKLK
jgi:hypothetical protein